MITAVFPVLDTDIQHLGVIVLIEHIY